MCVIQGFTTAGSDGIGFAAPVSTLASQPGPHRLPYARFPACCQTSPLPSFTSTSISETSSKNSAFPRCSDVPSVSHQPFEGCWRLRTPLLRFLSPSALKSGVVHSILDPKTGSGRDASSTAAFRPRRFYDLDGLLRHSLLPRFPRAALMGFLTLQGLPDSRGPRRYRRCLPLLVFSRPALPSQSLSLAPNQWTSRGLLV